MLKIRDIWRPGKGSAWDAEQNTSNTGHPVLYGTGGNPSRGDPSGVPLSAEGLFLKEPTQLDPNQLDPIWA